MRFFGSLFPFSAVQKSRQCDVAPQLASAKPDRFHLPYLTWSDFTIENAASAGERLARRGKDRAEGGRLRRHTQSLDRHASDGAIMKDQVVGLSARKLSSKRSVSVSRSTERCCRPRYDGGQIELSVHSNRPTVNWLALVTLKSTPSPNRSSTTDVVYQMTAGHSKAWASASA